jgi:hypothetical protein
MAGPVRLWKRGLFLAQISAETIAGSDHLPGDEDSSQKKDRRKK